MSYLPYSYYPSTSPFTSSSSSTSHPPHAGLELLLGAAELLETAAAGEAIGTSTIPLAQTSRRPRRRRSPRHPFRSKLESVDSRFEVNNTDSDSRESDMRASIPLPFIMSNTTQVERTSASWPGTSSSTSSSSNLFIPPQAQQHLNRPTLPQRALSSPTATTKRSSQTRLLEERDKHDGHDTSMILSSSSSKSPPASIKREQTAISCMRCRNTHKKCDEHRPCRRCVRVGRGDCEDAPARGLRLKTSPRAQQQDLPSDDFNIDTELQPYEQPPRSSSLLDTFPPFPPYPI